LENHNVQAFFHIFLSSCNHKSQSSYNHTSTVDGIIH
jgi:hypothetical protein